MNERQRRWDSEAAFFDNIAAGISNEALLLDHRVIARYRGARRPWFNKEFRFRLVGDLHGKRVLDVGCGEGSNAILLASMGAHVTGVDVSPACVEVARRRAVRAGVGDRVELYCSPLESIALPSATFDVIWGDGILHHLIPELESCLARLVGWAKDDALLVFSEPVNRAHWLRRLRGNLPIHTDATQDERPLSMNELALVGRFFRDANLRPFGLFERLQHLFVPRGKYEGASVLRRWVASALCLADHAALSLPLLERLGGMLVIWGRPAARGSNVVKQSVAATRTAAPGAGALSGTAAGSESPLPG